MPQTAEKSDSIVIIPTYNEKENAAAIIEAVLALQPRFDILIVDDNSPDGTADIVKKKIAEHPGRVSMLQRKGKLGLGTAYLEGFAWALDHGYEYILEMDADFSHNPSDVPLLRQAVADGADVSIGSRYCNGVNVVNWPLGRVLMSYFASKYVRIMTGIPVHDTTAGFVCYHRDVLSTLPLDKIKLKGYGFQIEMKFKAFKYGFKIVEVPIIFVNRRLGSSKMSGGIFSEALFGVISLRLSSIFKKYPKRPGSHR